LKYGGKKYYHYDYTGRHFTCQAPENKHAAIRYPLNRAWLYQIKNGEYKIITILEILSNKFYFPKITNDEIEKNEMGGACSTYGVRRGVYRFVVGNHLQDLGVDRWEDNIKMDF
jgi:hypothetical protein